MCAAAPVLGLERERARSWGWRGTVRIGGCLGHVRCGTHAGAEAVARAQMGLARQLFTRR